MSEKIKVLLSEEEVDARIRQIAAKISKDYAGKEIHMICVLKGRNPNSIHLCTLLDKPERRVKDVKVDYCCFNIPDEFVVGYGLDYAQKYRNLPFIGVVELDQEDQ